jgi:hypothetical protein
MDGNWSREHARAPPPRRRPPPGASPAASPCWARTRAPPAGRLPPAVPPAAQICPGQTPGLTRVKPETGPAPPPRPRPAPARLRPRLCAPAPPATPVNSHSVTQALQQGFPRHKAWGKRYRYGGGARSVLVRHTAGGWPGAGGRSRGGRGARPGRSRSGGGRRPRRGAGTAAPAPPRARPAGLPLGGAARARPPAGGQLREWESSHGSRRAATARWQFRERPAALLRQGPAQGDDGSTGGACLPIPRFEWCVEGPSVGVAHGRGAKAGEGWCAVVGADERARAKGRGCEARGACCPVSCA